MPRSTKDELAQADTGGREDALAALYDRWAERLYRTAWGLLGSREEAEDAVQDVFVALARTEGALERIQDPRAYLFASLRRAAARISLDRRKRQSSEAPAGTELMAKQADGFAPASARLERALASLPYEQREVLALKVDGGLTFEEIGAALGIRANTAASRYRYALEKLRLALEVSQSG